MLRVWNVSAFCIQLYLRASPRVRSFTSKILKEKRRQVARPPRRCEGPLQDHRRRRGGPEPAGDGHERDGEGTPGLPVSGSKFQSLNSNSRELKLTNLLGLVLGCIKAKFCKKILVGKLSPRSTRLHTFAPLRSDI